MAFFFGSIALIFAFPCCSAAGCRKAALLPRTLCQPARGAREERNLRISASNQNTQVLYLPQRRDLEAGRIQGGEKSAPSDLRYQRPPGAPQKLRWSHSITDHLSGAGRPLPRMPWKGGLERSASMAKHPARISALDCSARIPIVCTARPALTLNLCGRWQKFPLKNRSWLEKLGSCLAILNCFLIPRMFAALAHIEDTRGGGLMGLLAGWAVFLLVLMAV